MALGEAVTRRLAIGVGCRRACSADAIVAVIREAIAAFTEGEAALFTIDGKRGEAGLHDAASRLGLRLTFLPAADLAAVAHRVTRRSPRVLAAMGVPSVAEAAALVGAGPGSQLIVPRIAHAAVTCAVALASEIGA